jgi:hypothetical protein
VALAVLAPVVVAVRGWKKWRRGPEIRSIFQTVEGSEMSRLDLRLDVPLAAEPEFRRRLTDTVIRIAENLRMADDVYHLVYRLPWEEEPVVRPVGPKLQELGERFALIQAQGTMAGRTAVWLTLGRDRALAEVVDPGSYDPEAEGEPDGLLGHPDARWSMATEWARVGPSLVVRVILVVPSDQNDRIRTLLDSLRSIRPAAASAGSR